MNKTLKHVFLSALMALCALPAVAQLNGTGYYRVRNAQYSNEYIYLANDLLNYHTIVNAAGGAMAIVFDFSGTGAKAKALEYARLYLKTDIKMMTSDYIDPTSIIYAKKRNTSTSNYDYNLIGQGTSLLTLTTGLYDGSSADAYFVNIYATINSVSNNETPPRYTAKIDLVGHLNSTTGTEQTLGSRYFMDNNGIFDIESSSSNMRDQWYLEPVNYFNVLPEVEFNGKYYTTIKVPFAFKLSNNVEKAYAITANNNGVLDYTEVATTGGTVPAGTPVVLECASPNAADCKLIPTGDPLWTAENQNASSAGAPRANQSSSYTGTNLLAGTYFANTDGTQTLYSTSFNANNYIANTETAKKYVIGITDSGKLGFVYDNTVSVMPANKAWLTAAGEFPWELPKEDADLSYEQAEYTVYVGQNFETPTLTNPNSLTGITYSSSNTAAATVDANTGAVTIGNTAGDAVITATFAGNDQYYEGSASYTIHVLAKTTPELSFNPTTATAEAGADEFTPPALYNPLNLTVTYSSSNDSVALVDETSGYVVIGDAGTVVITAYYAGNYMYNSTSASYTITVNKKNAGLSYATTEYTVYTGQNFETPMLTNPNNLTVTYSSSNENLALVDPATGAVLIGDDAGDVIITASFAGNGEYNEGSASYTIHIQAKTTPELSFNPTSATAEAGADEFTPPALNNPLGLTVTYSSSNDTIALVDEASGYVVIGDAGTVVITATYAGNYMYNSTSASYTITVTKKTAVLSYDQAEYTAYIGEDFTAPTLYNPAGLKVTYSSSNEDLALVDEATGEVLIGETAGDVVITATFAGNGQYEPASATYTLHIKSKYLRGDVDANGVVDVLDATALINFLLYSDPTGINLENANCDLEGEVDIEDATSLINYLLYDTW